MPLFLPGPGRRMHCAASRLTLALKFGRIQFLHVTAQGLRIQLSVGAVDFWLGFSTVRQDRRWLAGFAFAPFLWLKLKSLAESEVDSVMDIASQLCEGHIGSKLTKGPIPHNAHISTELLSLP